MDSESVYTVHDSRPQYARSLSDVEDARPKSRRRSQINPFNVVPGLYIPGSKIASKITSTATALPLPTLAVLNGPKRPAVITQNVQGATQDTFEICRLTVSRS